MLFKTCMDWILGRAGNRRVTDPVFADDALILAEPLEIIGLALESPLHEEAKPFVYQVSWAKAMVFRGFQDDTV